MLAQRSKVENIAGRVGPDSFRNHELRAIFAALLEVGEDVVAAISWLEREDSVCLYYTGFEPAWSKYSVVTVATSEVLKYAIGAGIRRIEFLRGTDPFKRRWGTTQRLTVEVAVARRPALVRPLLQTAVAARGGFRRLRRRLSATAARDRD